MSSVQSKKITNPERIRRIIGILRLDGREIMLHFPNYVEAGKIIESTKDNFIVKISSHFMEVQEDNPEHVSINFVFSGVELFGKCPFIKQERAFITLEYPESLESRVKRRYPRIRVNGKVKAKLKFLKNPVTTFKEISSKDLPVKYSKLYWEVQRENVDIKRIFLLVGSEVKKISPLSEIIIYNDKNANTRDAQILRKSGKTLFVENCREVKSYTKLIPSDKIISYSYYFNEKRLSGALQDEMIEELKAIIKEDIAGGYTSKALVPFFSGGQVIGHIRVYSKDAENRLTYEDVSDVMVLANLLTIAIDKVGFVPKFDEGVESSLIDISEGGILLKVMDDDKKVDISEGTHLEIKLFLNDKELSVSGDILRKDDDEKSYAIRFEDLSPQVKREIKNFIDENIEKRDKDS